MATEGRWVLNPFIFFILLFVLSTQVFARDVLIFDVKKTLPLKETDPVYRDYYISGGTEDGLKLGTVVSIFRRKTLRDSFQSQAAEQLMVEVGRLKVFHVQKKISVARLYKLKAENQIPVLDTVAVMVGDLVDMDTAIAEIDIEKKTKVSVKTLQTPLEEAEIKKVLKKSEMNEKKSAIKEILPERKGKREESSSKIS